MVRRAISNLPPNGNDVTAMGTGRAGWFPAQLLSGTRESTWVNSIQEPSGIELGTELRTPSTQRGPLSP